MSSLSEMNISDTWLYFNPSRSAWMIRSDLQLCMNQSVSIERTLSWRSVYRWNMILELQLERTCWLVWICWHNGHFGSDDFPYLVRFDAFSNCCWIAFRMNLNNGSASVSISFDHFAITDLLNDSQIAVIIFPWILSNERWFIFLWFWSVLSERRAVCLFVLFERNWSVALFLLVVSEYNVLMSSLLFRFQIPS